MVVLWEEQLCQLIARLKQTSELFPSNAATACKTHKHHKFLKCNQFANLLQMFADPGVCLYCNKFGDKIGDCPLRRINCAHGVNVHLSVSRTDCAFDSGIELDVYAVVCHVRVNDVCQLEIARGDAIGCPEWVGPIDQPHDETCADGSHMGHRTYE